MRCSALVKSSFTRPTLDQSPPTMCQCASSRQARHLFHTRYQSLLDLDGLFQCIDLLLEGLGAQIAIAVLIVRPEETWLRTALAVRFLPLPDGISLPVGHPGLIVLVAAVACLGTITLLRPGPLERGMFWALVASGFALVPTPSAVPPVGGLSTPLFFFSTAGLVLIVATVEASYAMAYRDALTLIPGRRALDEALDRPNRYSRT